MSKWEGGVNNFFFFGLRSFGALELRAIVENILKISWLLSINLKSSMADFEIFKSLGGKSVKACISSTAIIITISGNTMYWLYRKVKGWDYRAVVEIDLLVFTISYNSNTKVWYWYFYHY